MRVDRLGGGSSLCKKMKKYETYLALSKPVCKRQTQTRCADAVVAVVTLEEDQAVEVG